MVKIRYLNKSLEWFCMHVSNRKVKRTKWEESKFCLAIDRVLSKITSHGTSKAYWFIPGEKKRWYLHNTKRSFDVLIFRLYQKNSFVLKNNQTPDRALKWILGSAKFPLRSKKKYGVLTCTELCYEIRLSYFGRGSIAQNAYCSRDIYLQ